MNYFSKKVKSMAGLIGLMCLFLGILTPSLVFAIKFKHIVTFGDSLSDHGNLHSYVSEAPEAKTNGDVWVEYLAKELNATLDNNAFIGAMTSKHLSNDLQEMSDNGLLPQFGLISQVDRYIAETNNFDPDETLFTILIGANNLIKFGYGELGSDPEAMVTNAMTDIAEAFTKLLNIGATNFIVLTLPNIGISPFYNWRPTAEIELATQLAAAYNLSLKLTVNQLIVNKPQVSLYIFDLFEVIDDLINEGIFSNVTGSYMKLDEEYYIIPGETNGPPENYLFYDSVHPTTKAHEYFAKVVANRVIYDGYYTQKELDDAVLAEKNKWDIKMDNKLGLEEAIQALKTCSGINKWNWRNRKRIGNP